MYRLEQKRSKRCTQLTGMKIGTIGEIVLHRVVGFRMFANRRDSNPASRG